MKKCPFITKAWILLLSVIFVTSCAASAKHNDPDKMADTTVELVIATKDVTVMPQTESAVIEKEPMTIFFYKTSAGTVKIVLNVCTNHNKKLNTELQCPDYDTKKGCSPWEMPYNQKGKEYVVTRGTLYSALDEYLKIVK